MVLKNRAERVSELEEIFSKRVFVIVYDASQGGIKLGDWIWFKSHFIDTVLGKEDKNCIFIFEGIGGNLKTAILCSELLRKNIKRYSIFVPTVAASALCYFILQSDKLLIGDKSCVTQLDAVFDSDNEEIRAIKALNHPDPRIKSLAKETHSFLLERIKKILKNTPHVFNKGVAKKSQKKLDYLCKVADAWMGKEKHESPIKRKDLIKMEVNFQKINEKVIKKATELIEECRKELKIENKRFTIQTSKIESGLFGGFFYS